MIERVHRSLGQTAVQKLRKVLYGIGLAAGLCLLIVQVVNGYSSISRNAEVVVRPQFVIPALASAVLAIAAQMLAWMCLMRGLGVALNWRQVMEGYMLSFLPRYIPGSIWGYLGRNEWLRQDHAVPYSVSTVGSIAELAASLTSNLMLAGLCYTLSVTGWCKAGLFLGILAVPVIAWALLRSMSAWPLLRLSPLLAESCRALRVIGFRRWTGSVGLFLGHWCLQGTAVMLLFNSMSVVTAELSFNTLLRFTATYSIAWLVGFLILVAPAGVGFRESALAGLLVNGSGMAGGEASVLAILARVVFVASELAWVIAGAIHRRLAHRVA
jgi:hypothetical protein